MTPNQSREHVNRSLFAAAAVAMVASIVGGCAAPIARARTTPEAPPMPREVRADSAVANQRCTPRWSGLAPGMWHLCRGHTGEGVAMLGLAAAELAAGAVAVERHGFTLRHPGVLLPFLGFQNLLAYDGAMTRIEEDLAQRKLFTPQDDLAELARAPFNLHVLKQPYVLASIIGTTAAAVGLTAILDDGTDAASGDEVNYFGRRLDPEVGYPVAGATFGALFTHVALGEEAAFRGRLQSSLARSHGETRGWVLSSLVFGAAHIPNALFLGSADARRDYLLIGVPFITAVGSVMGLNYRWAGYSLTAPVAVHFWYNLLLSTVELVRDPGDSMLSASMAVGF